MSSDPFLILKHNANFKIFSSFTKDLLRTPFSIYYSHLILSYEASS